jgi:hypothetical protein
MNIGNRIRWDDLRCRMCQEQATHMGIDAEAYRDVIGVRWVHKPESPYAAEGESDAHRDS